MSIRAVAALTIGALTLAVPAASLLAETPAVNVTVDTIGVHHPDCTGIIVDVNPGAPTPIAGTVWVKAGNNHYNVGFHPAGYIAGPQDGHAVSHVDVCPPTGTTTSTTTRPSSTTTTSPTSSTTTTTVVINTVVITPPSTTGVTTSTTTTLPGTTTTSPASTTTLSSTSTTTSSTTTTTSTTPPSTSTSLPDTFTFGAAGTICVNEVPTIRITFQSPGFPSLAGQTGTLTMRDANGIVVSTQPLVYNPGITVDILYPGTTTNPDGTIDDVPGWILTDDGFWIEDPSDAYLRDGITLTYTVNPTAGPVPIDYPPESSACANPDGPFAPGVTPPLVPGALPPTR